MTLTKRKCPKGNPKSSFVFLVSVSLSECHIRIYVRMIFGTDQTKFTESFVSRVSGLVLLLKGPYKVTVRLLNRLEMCRFALPFVNVGFMNNSSFEVWAVLLLYMHESDCNQKKGCRSFYNINFQQGCRHNYRIILTTRIADIIGSLPCISWFIITILE
jgi:hypothetical protein